MLSRYAYIERRTDIALIRAYLPANYHAEHVCSRSGGILIYGQDRAGWTLDGYVIPRLASGLYFAREIDVVEASRLQREEMTV